MPPRPYCLAILRKAAFNKGRIARHYAVRGVEFLSEYVYFERFLFARDRFLWTLLTDSRLLPPSDATFVAAA
jgi:hypothetical protein